MPFLFLLFFRRIHVFTSFCELITETGLVEGAVVTADWTQETLPSWLDSIWQGIVRPQGLVRFGVPGLIKSLREVPTLLLMRIAFGSGLL